MNITDALAILCAPNIKLGPELVAEAKLTVNNHVVSNFLTLSKPDPDRTANDSAEEAARELEDAFRELDEMGSEKPDAYIHTITWHDTTIRWVSKCDTVPAKYRPYLSPRDAVHTAEALVKRVDSSVSSHQPLKKVGGTSRDAVSRLRAFVKAYKAAPGWYTSPNPTLYTVNSEKEGRHSILFADLERVLSRFIPFEE